MAGNSDDLRKMLRTLSILVIFILSIYLIHFILSIVVVVIGAVFRWQCQIQTNIPVYLIVIGSVSIFYYGLASVFVSKVLKEKSKEKFMEKLISKVFMTIMAVVLVFQLAWNITGAVWVFGTKTTVQSSDLSLSTYCHSIPYYFAFAYCIFSFIVLFLPCLASLISIPYMMNE
ncbi:unnamed protein product [Adineta ricciae]|uniref:Uncharacterized protein n=1 Tax=Adineta ricciae TaxID=249248 RepID=A0A815QFR5_ADIRI|nr:unnamed protein product [Adineta ricciae]